MSLSEAATDEQPSSVSSGPDAASLPTGGHDGPAVATWKALVRSRVARLRAELEQAEATVEQRHDVTPSERRLVAAQTREAINEAGSYTRRRGILTPFLWLSGTEIEQAWAALHRADELLLLIQPPETVRARAPEFRARIRSQMSATDPRSAEYEEQLRALMPPAPILERTKARVPQVEPGRPYRQQLQVILRTLNDINDDAHGRLRSFRNVVLAATVVLSVLLIVIAFDDPSNTWVPICGASDFEDDACPAVWQVLFLGALGGALSGVAALRKLQGFAGPYAVPMVMAAFKIPVGALTGLLGVIWMQNGVLGSIGVQEGDKILAYAALFGVAQAALTAFADSRAGDLLGQAKAAQTQSAP